MIKNTVFMLMLMVILCTSLESFAYNIEMDWMTFQQPNGIEFAGRGWGNEFEFYWETKEGFRFVKNYETGFWCYAILSEQGDFRASDYPVGIARSELVGVSKNLQFSDDYKNEIRKRRDEFEEQLRKIREEIKSNNGSLDKVTATRTVWVDILLVEFDNVEHNISYTNTDYNTMFASDGVYDDQEPPTPHPDNKPVYGSVHDYWDDMTNGDVDIDGAVWNTSAWITLDYTKSYYDTHSESIFINEIASKSGYNFGSLTNDHLCAILYAGNEYLGGTLHPHYTGGSHRYMMAAEFSRPQNSENPDNFFANIGTHCHELSHAAFGLPDRYYSYTYNQWGLMAIGNKNGPSNELACPAPLNPYDREDNGWISFQNFTGGEQNKQFSYNYSSPQVFKIAESGDDFFLIENRQRSSGFDRCLPAEGLLVWHKFSTGILDLIEADNSQTDITQTGDPFPGSSNKRHLNDFTSPNCKYIDDTNSNLVLHNISDASSSMHADLGEKWFGNIPDALTWENTVQVGGDVTVGTGKTLTIASGTNINFATIDYTSGGSSAGKSELIINGTLEADNATFTCSSANGYYGVRFTSTASNTSSLENCTITNAEYPVYVNNSSPTVDGCTISGGNKGIYVINSSAAPLIINCNVTAAQYGLYVSNSAKPSIDDCKFTSPSWYPAYIANGADGEISRCFFRVSGTPTYNYLFYTAGTGTNPWVGGCLFDLGQTTVTRAVYAAGGSPELGDNITYIGGYNDFLNLASGEYYVYNTTGSTIKAENNYWGASSPQDTWFYGSVDNYPYFSTSQNAGPTWKRAVDPIVDAIAAYRNNNYQDAKDYATQALNEKGDSQESAEALFYYAKASFRLGTLKEDLPYIESYLTAKDAELAHQAQNWVAFAYASQRDLKKAEDITFQSPKGTFGERELLLQLISYYAAYGMETKVERLEKVFLAGDYPDDVKDRRDDLAAAKNNADLGMFGNETQPIETTQTTANEETSLVAYPNPFNASTKLAFRVENAGLVSLAIYNTLGQNVRTLLDAPIQAGRHEVVWDGQDEFGQTASTGIYLCRLLTGSRQQTMKILLVK